MARQNQSFVIVYDILISPESIDSSFKRFNTRGFHYVARQAIPCVNDSLCEEVLSEVLLFSILNLWPLTGLLSGPTMDMWGAASGS